MARVGLRGLGRGLGLGFHSDGSKPIVVCAMVPFFYVCESNSRLSLLSNYP